jgi:hypothetical protein
MKLSEQISARFQELEKQANEIPLKPSSRPSEEIVANDEDFHKWASSAIHLVGSVFGEKSPHYRNLYEAYLKYLGYATGFFIARGIFLAAKSDYEGGYLFNIEATISGEIFADFVVLAKNALANNQKDVAAVLSCAALEDALKRYANLRDIQVDGKVMQEVINALKAKGLVSGPQKSLLDSMPRVRDAAMHADWQKITPQEVGSVIGFVEQFLLTQF